MKILKCSLWTLLLKFCWDLQYKKVYNLRGSFIYLCFILFYFVFIFFLLLFFVIWYHHIHPNTLSGLVENVCSSSSSFFYHLIIYTTIFVMMIRKCFQFLHLYLIFTLPSLYIHKVSSLMKWLQTSSLIKALVIYWTKGSVRALKKVSIIFCFFNFLFVAILCGWLLSYSPQGIVLT